MLGFVVVDQPERIVRQVAIGKVGVCPVGLCPHFVLSPGQAQ
jgi:hypothetical protein